ncbi:HIT family protein [Amycolatopsis nalaikhensis]|uniref:HIT domain-containing protein n=1 Tax=Amycolatopsis nalaikhensis TaxID=715472 RepID=A0ABY8XYN5_9PSEU|nr:HIT domain-containing protein [Amycolatopsis sp. 2-2]WIV60708.1 HIT domain-containing protein [Amycolatopsis sp. 2-2]
MCADQGSPDTGFGVRYLVGRNADAYLQRSGQVRGYSHVIWRGRHVAEVTQLSAPEAAGFWLDVVDAARAVQAVCRPVTVNISVLGNGLPHLHAHLIPRYADGDPRPGRPLPHRYLDHGRQDEALLARCAADLATFLAARRDGDDVPVA